MDPIESPIRALHAWEDLNGVAHLAVGAEQSLNVVTECEILNITPQIETSEVAPSFSTTEDSTLVSITDAGILPNSYYAVEIRTPVSVGGLILFGVYAIFKATGVHAYQIATLTAATETVTIGGVLPIFDTSADSAFVTVTFPNHGKLVGDTTRFLVSTSVGGLTVTGAYLVQEVLDEDSYTIGAATRATSTATVTMNNGEVDFRYYIVDGPLVSVGGYGVGTYGSGPYGVGQEIANQIGDRITTTDWSLDNWGQILLACPVDGAIYQWAPDSGLTVARIIPEAPNVNGGMFIAMPQQIVVAWGSSIEGLQDPLLVKWSDAGNFANWTATSGTHAGSRRIPTGSKIVGGCQAPQQALIWTDVDVWAMSYIGQPFVFGFNKIMSGCGLIGQHASTILGTNVYWMSEGQFWVMGGGAPQPIPCPIWDVVFQNLDTDQLRKVRAATNSKFHEVIWFYPSLDGNGEVDRFVKLNAIERSWDYGVLSRTAWIDQSVFGEPVAGTADGILYQHEIGYNDDEDPITANFTTGYFMIAEGNEFAFVDLIIPDFKFGEFGGANDADIRVTVYFVDYPGDTPREHGPYTIQHDDQRIHLRGRGRQMAFKVESTDLDSFWRLGRVRYRYAPDGRR